MSGGKGDAKTVAEIERGLMADRQLALQQVLPAALLGMWARLIFVTPEVARDWIARSRQRNRSETRYRINRLISQITGDRWRVNGDTIVKSWDDDILNGHGRLIACAECGVGFWSWVVFGVDPAAMPTFDTNKIRTCGDDMEIAGAANAHQASGVARAIWLAERGMLRYWQQSKDKTGFTNQDGRDLLDKEPGFMDTVRAGMRLNKTFRAVTPTVFAMLYHVLPGYHPEKGREFVERLADGSGLVEGDPVFALRRRLMNNLATRAKLAPAVVVALCIKAWLAYVRGQRLVAIKFGENEEFPDPNPDAAAAAQADGGEGEEDGEESGAAA